MSVSSFKTAAVNPKRYIIDGPVGERQLTLPQGAYNFTYSSLPAASILTIDGLNRPSSIWSDGNPLTISYRNMDQIFSRTVANTNIDGSRLFASSQFIFPNRENRYYQKALFYITASNTFIAAPIRGSSEVGFHTSTTPFSWTSANFRPSPIERPQNIEASAIFPGQMWATYDFGQQGAGASGNFARSTNYGSTWSFATILTTGDVFTIGEGYLSPYPNPVYAALRMSTTNFNLYVSTNKSSFVVERILNANDRFNAIVSNNKSPESTWVMSPNSVSSYITITTDFTTYSYRYFNSTLFTAKAVYYSPGFDRFYISGQTTSTTSDTWVYNPQSGATSNLSASGIISPISVTEYNDYLVVGAKQGRVYISTNGSSWTLRNLPNMMDLAYAAAGQDSVVLASNSKNAMVVSTDLANWTTFSPLNVPAYGGEHGNSASNIRIFSSLRSNKTQAITNGGVFFTTDGYNWNAGSGSKTTWTSWQSSSKAYLGRYNNGSNIFYSGRPNPSLARNYVTYVSVEGGNDQSYGFSLATQEVFYAYLPNQGVHVATTVGGSKGFSYDGMSWTSTSTWFTASTNGGQIGTSPTDVTDTPLYFLSIRDSRIFRGTAVSDNWIFLTTAASNLSAINSNPNTGTVVALGTSGAGLLSTDNGLSFSQITAGSNSISDVAVGNSIIVAVHSNGYLTSSNGTTWTTYSTGSFTNVSYFEQADVFYMYNNDGTDFAVLGPSQDGYRIVSEEVPNTQKIDL